MREALRPYRERIGQEAARLFARGDGDWAKVMRLALAGSIADEKALGLLIAAIEKKGVEGACEEAERILSLHPPLKERRAPPEGWGPMREIVEELRVEKLTRGSEESSIEFLFLLATELAHFAPLHRALLARAIYGLYREEWEKLLSLYQALVHQAPRIEREDPLLQRVLGAQGAR